MDLRNFTFRIFDKYILLTLFLLMLPVTAAASCDPFGNITGTNGSIVLGTAGCADASGNMNATLFSGASITSPGDGLTALLAAGHNPWNITNAGSISAAGNGINLQDGGDTVTNTGFIISTNSNGIFAPGGSGFQPITLINSGTIDALNGSGVLLLGGATVINQVGGVIAGGLDGVSISINGSPVSGLNSSVDNAGTIEGGTFGTGVSMGLGGSVINRATGLIDGFVGVGINTNASIVNNFGEIGTFANTSTAIILQAGGVVNNFAGGQLLAQSRGISVDGGPAIVNNDGTITAANGRGIDFGITSSGGTVNNSATGVITSGAGTRAIIFEGGPGVVNNSGTIAGGSVAAIQMMLGNSAVNNNGVIQGNVFFTGSNDTFLMTGGKMVGQLVMGTTGNEIATLQNVTDANISSISLFNGGGGGHDNLIFNNAQHMGGSDMVNWETINVTNNSALTLSSNLTLGGLSADPTATLNINSATLNANNLLNSVIEANTARPVLVNNAGIINIASPRANNSLTIRGDYVGKAGSLVLNAILNSDNSPADKLVIDGKNGGSNATGNTFVAVHNVGGVGAQTVGNGILVVNTINGSTTSPGAFSLSGPVTAGPYEYLLFRGGMDGTSTDNWYLRSMLSENIPNFRREVSLFAAIPSVELLDSRTMLGTFHQRVGAEDQVHDPGCFFKGAWTRIINRGGNIHNGSIFRNGPNFTYHFLALQTGVDIFHREYAEGHRDFSGVYGALGDGSAGVDHVFDIRAGSIDFYNYNAGVYWTHLGPSNWYLDGVIQSNWFKSSNDSRRIVKDVNGTTYAASLEGGYPFRVTNHFSVEPQAQIIYQSLQGKKIKVDASRVDFNPAQSLISRLGARLLWEGCMGSSSPRKLSIWLTGSAWHESKGKSTIEFSTSTTPIPFSSTINGTWAELDLGATAQLTKELSVYATIGREVYLHNGRGKAYDAIGGVRVNL